MSALLQALAPAFSDSAKRLVVLLLTMAVAALNRKLGLDMTETEVATMVGAVSVWMVQSGLKAITKAKVSGVAATVEAEAAKTPEAANLDAAIANLNAAAKP